MISHHFPEYRYIWRETIAEHKDGSPWQNRQSLHYRERIVKWQWKVVLALGSIREMNNRITANKPIIIQQLTSIPSNSPGRAACYRTHPWIADKGMATIWVVSRKTGSSPSSKRLRTSTGSVEGVVDFSLTSILPKKYHNSPRVALWRSECGQPTK